MNISHLAKVELHLHWEGAAPPAFIRQLAYEKKLALAVFSPPMGAMLLVVSPNFLRFMKRRHRCCKAPRIFTA